MGTRSTEAQLQSGHIWLSKDHRFDPGRPHFFVLFFFSRLIYYIGRTAYVFFIKIGKIETVKPSYSCYSPVERHLMYLYHISTGTPFGKLQIVDTFHSLLERYS